MNLCDLFDVATLGIAQSLFVIGNELVNIFVSKEISYGIAFSLTRCNRLPAIIIRRCFSNTYIDKKLTKILMK